VKTRHCFTRYLTPTAIRSCLLGGWIMKKTLMKEIRRRLM
jgi:hypothetical protein